MASKLLCFAILLIVAVSFGESSGSSEDSYEYEYEYDDDANVVSSEPEKITGRDLDLMESEIGKLTELLKIAKNIGGNEDDPEIRNLEEALNDLQEVVVILKRLKARGFRKRRDTWHSKQGPMLARIQHRVNRYRRSLLRK